MNLMIKPGIKIAPTGWRSRLERSHAKYTEVWYNCQEPATYREMFAYLRKQGINAGLHFWGVIEGRYEPNLAYPGVVLQETIRLIKATIDVAAEHHFHYVVAHCGNRRLVKLNLKQQLFSPDVHSTLISLETAQTTLEQSFKELRHYASQRGILFLVETVVAKTGAGSMLTLNGRLNAVDYFTVPVQALIDLSQKHNLPVANDFCHTFGDDYDKPLPQLWRSLWRKTKALAPYTKLVHINTVVPPYNGTDSHGGITDKDFQIKGAFPTKTRLKELLRLFKNRNDVWAINEPRRDHVGNYQALVKLLKTL